MKYQTILLDPPWPYTLRKGDSKHRNEVTNHYSEMSLSDILNLPITKLADDTGCGIWLWTTNNHLPSAFQCLDNWGVNYKTIYHWVKTTNDTKRVRIGTGHWSRNATESLLFGTIGKLPSFTHTGTLGGQSNVIFAPRREHSRKPEKFYCLIEKLQPDSTKIELFARHSRIGWDQFGNEVTKFDTA